MESQLGESGVSVVYPFFLTGTTKRLVGEIFSVLSTAKKVDQGLAYAGALVESVFDVSDFASEQGWEIKWIWNSDVVKHELGDKADIVRLAFEFDKADHVAVTFSNNTNSYYLFMSPSNHVYHFTYSDVLYYYYTRNKDCVLDILKEEHSLLHGNEEAFTKLNENVFAIDFSDDEELAKELKETSVKMQYVTKQLINCAYVVAELHNGDDNVVQKAWRRVELPSLCLYKYDIRTEKCYKALVKQFIKP
ncbi:MAG: hypothetical protein JHC26_09945 [Thermofilum sp.]|jgi:hypothetical protein|uniref:hypothetical protein n=1 Tax=Thermofilum sp. TaxID=1961369 RepID=UPI0025858D5D|nr:hypothetical protein [Thermofilum sp.]MCI4409404.1 hypothetical protein [Thermofilum sp.]